MPAPAAASAATRCPNRAAAARPRPGAAPRRRRRSSSEPPGPIQPRLAASANTKAIPSKVTMPPARASPRGPVSHERSIGSRTGRRRSGGSFGIGVGGGIGPIAGRTPRSSSSSTRMEAASSAVRRSSSARRAVSASMRALPSSTARQCARRASTYKSLFDERYGLLAGRRFVTGSPSSDGRRGTHRDDGRDADCRRRRDDDLGGVSLSSGRSCSARCGRSCGARSSRRVAT